MERYRWELRPLILVAPRADDERLAAQVAALRKTEAAFRERGLALIVVLGEGPSQAGTRPLDPPNADALRERYGVAPDVFALRLVGKDGGVKRRASEPVSPGDL